MKRRNIAIVLIAAIFAALFSGCGSNPPTQESTAPTQAQTSTPADKDAPDDNGSGEPSEENTPDNSTSGEPAEEIHITYGLSQSETHIGSMASIYMAEYIMDRDPSFVFDLYFNSQLGDEATMLQSLMTGSIDMMGVSFSTLSSTVPEMNVMSLPFFFGSPENFCNVLRDDAFSEKSSSLISDAMGIYPVGVLGVFVRSIANTERTVRTPDDLKGLKIRVMSNQLYMDVFTALGATPVALAFPEVYTGLQQGVVHGEDTGLETMVSNSYYEIEKYYSEVNYLYTGGYECVSSKLWSQLSGEQKALFIEAANAANDYFLELREEAYQGYVETVEASGVEVYTPTDDELELFRQALLPIIEQYAFISDASTDLYYTACDILGYEY